MNQAIKLNPNYAQASDDRGISNYDKRDFDRTVGAPESVLKTTLNYTISFSGHGSSYENQREGDRIIQDPNEAIKINHYNAYAFTPDSDEAAPTAVPAADVTPATVAILAVTARPEPAVLDVEQTPLPKARPKPQRH
jgi:hypothetical protein